MSYRVAFMMESEHDMNDIEEYLAQFHAGASRKFFDTLKERISTLRDMPRMCQAYERDPFFRQMVLGDYLLFYSVDDKRKLVVVHRVLHHSRDVYRHIPHHQ